MFNLDQSIAEWRRQMAASGIKTAELLDELEGHLRDDVDQQVQSGSSAPQAFETAVQRIGQGSRLKAEFAKVGVSSHPQRWKLMLVCCAGAAALVLLTSAWTFLNSAITWRERMLGFAAISLIVLYLCSLPRLYRFLPGISNKRVREAMRVAAVFACPIWTLLLFMPADLGVAPHFLIFALSAIFPPTVFAISYGLNEDSFRLDHEPFYFPGTTPLTPVAQQSFDFAREEASRLNHDFIGTEHLLLGLLKLERGVAAQVMERLGLDRDSVREEIAKIVGAGYATGASRAHPFTPRVRKALKLAASEARALNHSHVGSEHIFLGLLLEGDGVAFRVLNNLGIDAETARKEILKELGPESQ